MAKSKKKEQSRGLTLLGKQTGGIPQKVSPEVLETFENRYAHRDYTIRFDCEDFTSLCPVTGQPDFASILIEYVADKLCIETKSLKFYLGSYRNCASFNEEVSNRILEDLSGACKPRWMRVSGRFASRGGISVSVEAEVGGKPSRK